MASIIASASVPSEHRLDGANTTDLALIRADLAQRIQELDSTYVQPLTDAEVALRLGVAEQEVRAARFPMNRAYAGRADIPTQRATTVVTDVVDDDLALVQAAIQANPAAVRKLADAIRNQESGDDRYAAGYVDGLQRALAARPAGCPSYCTEDHRGFVGEVDGFSIGLGHEVVVMDLTADDPATTTGTATARVLVESTTERGEVITPTRVVLSIAEGNEGHYPGSVDVQGWSGAPDEVEQLAHALLSAARIARHA